MTNLLILRNMVRGRIGVPVHDDYFTDPVMNTNINLAIIDIESINRWPWSYRSEEIEIPATGYYDLPRKWRTTQAVTIDRNEVHEITEYDMERKVRADYGIPEYYSVVDRQLRFAPIPSDPVTARHYFFVDPDLLSIDTDEPRIPDIHVGVIVAKAAQLCSIREDDRAAAESHAAEYMLGVDRMKKSVRPTIRPTSLRVRRGSWI